MALKVSAPNGVKVYSVAGSAVLPSWLTEKKKASLRKDEEFRRRVDLIQELEFPVSSSRAKLSPDGDFLVVTGIHPPQARCATSCKKSGSFRGPQVKVYELGQLALKFERHLLSEVVDFQVLTDDYSKLVFACVDRSLVFHARYGAHFTARLPRVPRSVAFDTASASLVAAGSGAQLFRLSLELGHFLQPFASASPGVNIVRVCPVHGLVAAGGEDGAVECFDLRMRFPSSCLHTDDRRDIGVTALRFDNTGMTLAVGTEGGHVVMYDLRSSRPLLRKDHMYGMPIVDLKWHSAAGGERRVISADARVVRIWDATSGEPFTSIEPEGGVNDVCVWPGRGLLLVAGEARRLAPYFVPALGAAPRWCAFLENLTEEMEETSSAVLYDDYRFVTAAELQRLGIESAVGTALLRPYMHGFFIDNRLYGKAVALAAPFDFSSYRSARVRAKLDAEHGSRITATRRLPRVNAALAARLMADGVTAKTSDGEADVSAAAPSLLEDSRFAALFKDPRYAVDMTGPEYRAIHPGSVGNVLLHEHFSETVEEPADIAAPRMFVARDAAAAVAFEKRESSTKAKTFGERSSTSKIQKLHSDCLDN